PHAVVDDFGAYVSAGGEDLQIGDGETYGSCTHTCVGAPNSPSDVVFRAPGAANPAPVAGLFALLDANPSPFGFTVSFAGGPMLAFGFDVVSAASLAGTTVALSNGRGSLLTPGPAHRRDRDVPTPLAAYSAASLRAVSCSSRAVISGPRSASSRICVFWNFVSSR